MSNCYQTRAQQPTHSLGVKSTDLQRNYMNILL